MNREIGAFATNGVLSAPVLQQSVPEWRGGLMLYSGCEASPRPGIVRDSTNVLTAVLVAGFGRSGSTALMSLLAAAPRVAFDRIYPFEHRHLTYIAKLALLLER